MGLLFYFGQNALDWYTEIHQKQKPALIIGRVNNRISKTSAFAAEILYIMLKIKN
jgi:hypothetical protein